jgi:hypothetical protein
VSLKTINIINNTLETSNQTECVQVIAKYSVGTFELDDHAQRCEALHGSLGKGKGLQLYSSNTQHPHKVSGCADKEYCSKDPEKGLKQKLAY